jgi:hypothetical protein
MMIVVLAVLAGILAAAGRGALATSFAALGALLALRVLHECAAAQPPLLAAVEEQSVQEDDAARTLLERASSTARPASFEPAPSPFHGAGQDGSLTPAMEREE